MNEDFYELVERAIDVAFEEDKYLFKCYNYLLAAKTTRDGPGFDLPGVGCTKSVEHLPSPKAISAQFTAYIGMTIE